MFQLSVKKCPNAHFSWVHAKIKRDRVSALFFPNCNSVEIKKQNWGQQKEPIPSGQPDPSYPNANADVLQTFALWFCVP